MSETDINPGGDITGNAEKKLDFFRLGILAVFVAYFLNVAARYSGWIFLDGVNLLMHEAGHMIFMIFGNEFLTIAGGTIMQLLIPILFVSYFYFTGQKFSAALVIFWLGESIINVSWYMADAITMALPLLTGDNSGHDWHNMFSMFKLLPMTQTFANAVRIFGSATILGGLMLGVKACYRQDADEFKRYL